MKKQLKFLYAVLVGIVAFSFTACSDDDDESEVVSVESIVGTWKGYSEGHAPTEEQMEARFYEDGTCVIWWYHNPLLCSYYFEGSYSVTKKKLRLNGLWCAQGDRPDMEYDKTVDYSIEGEQLRFKFDLAYWTLSKK